MSSREVGQSGLRPLEAPEPLPVSPAPLVQGGRRNSEVGAALAPADGATAVVAKSRQPGAPFVAAFDYVGSHRHFLGPGVSTVWTTYGVTDEHGLIRYVGCTTETLPNRLYGHIAAARRARHGAGPRWLAWLRTQLVQRRPVSIVEISVDTRRWEAIEKERTVIAGMAAAGADLLNTHDVTRRRCLRCGRLDYPNTHVCCDSRAAIVSYRPDSVG